MLEKIIMENERLIYSIASYFRGYDNKEDLFQVGCIGLIKAYNNYDSNMNVKFTTYAYPYILGEMRKLVREDKSMKISRDISKINLQIEKAYVLLTQKMGKEPTASEIASFLEVPISLVVDALNSSKVSSLDDIIYDNLIYKGRKPYAVVSNQSGEYLVAFYSNCKDYRNYSLTYAIIDNRDYKLMPKEFLKEIEYNEITL